MTQIRKPAVLVENRLHADWVARPLVDAGFELDTCPFAEIPTRLATGAYNVLLLGRYSVQRKTKQEELAFMIVLRNALHSFLEAGGGALLFSSGSDIVPIDVLTEGAGAAFLEMMVEEPDHPYHNGGQVYACTRWITGPIATGVNAVWYPSNLSPAPDTRPVQADEAAGWQIVVRASPTSKTVPLPSKGYGLPGEHLSGFEGSVPLMALRDGLPGRLALCGFPALHHVFSPHNYPLGRQFLSEGFAGTPSDMVPLLVNTLRWLAAPSLADGKLGGGKTSPTVLCPQVPQFPKEPPIRWAERVFPPEPQPRFGLIGARTAYSTGRGTVADYVAKAKSAGLDFLVFLEDFTALDDAGLQALKADCEANTSDTFLAVPGFTLKDIVGTHYFQYGYRVALPRADLLAADGKTLSPQPTGAWRNGRIDNVHCRFIYGELGARCRKGPYLHRQTPKWIVDNRFNDSFAVVTWEAGQVVEDVRDEFRAIMDKGVRLHPTVLTFMNAPEDIDAALKSGWRNAILEPYAAMPDRVLRKHMAPELEWWGTIDETVTRSPRYRFDCWQYGMPFQYVTDGPAIHAWTVSVSDRDREWREPDHAIPPTADAFRADVIGFRLRWAASAAAGLAEVRLYDGDRLLRRWAGNGQQTLALEIDLAGHQQMNLMLEVLDARGGRALTSDYLVYRRDWCEFSCADRNNPLQIGYEKDAQGTAYGWSGTEHLTYNLNQWGGTSPYTGRWWYDGDRVYPAPMDPLHDITSPTDGGVGYGAGGLHLKPHFPALDPPELGLMLNPVPRMISADATVCDFICDHGYDRETPYFFGTDNTGFGLFGAYPTRYIAIRRRSEVFRPKPGALTTLRLRHEIQLKRAWPTTAGSLPYGWLDKGPVHVLHRRDGSRLELAGRTGDDGVPWLRGEPLVAGRAGRRPAIFINDGVDLLLVSPAGDERLAIHIPTETLPAPGKTVVVQIIGSGGTWDHVDPDIAVQMLTAMGYTGRPAYRLNMERGTCHSQRLFLELDLERNESVAFQIDQASLPMPIPVLVRGVNPHWPVFMLDRAGRRCRPLGVCENTTYATVDVATGATSLVIGHPVTADRPEVVLNLVRTSPESWVMEVHNPGETRVHLHVKRSPWFDLVRWDGAEIDLAAGASWSENLRTV